MRLRSLRQERGISLAKLAGLTFYTKGYLSKVENGEKPLTLAVARACDDALKTEGLLERVVLEDNDSQDQNNGEPLEECPYRGLSAYGPDDARWFFGRERDTAALVSLLGEHLESESPGLLMLVAPSGAGKSSLLRAGLLPALAQGVLPRPECANWPVVLLTPGEHPVEELLSRVSEASGASRPLLAQALQQSPESFASAVREYAVAGRSPADPAPAGKPGSGAPRAVLVVDQFEESFTLCESEDERSSFIQALHALATAHEPAHNPGPPAGLVVLGIRADFYGQCLAHPGLLAAARYGHVPLGPMTTAQLRDAITKPAEEAGLEVEPGLVEILLRDAGAVTDGPHDATARPGVLPLVSHALLATWQQREGKTLAVAGYRTTGGISGAVAATAEHVYTALPPARQPVARRLLLHLVRIGDTGETSHRMERQRLLAREADPQATAEVLEAFAGARLLTVGAAGHAGHVELAHEALLEAWPRLRAWIDEDRAGLRTRQLVLEAAETWERDGRDKELLYRGTRLAAAREWADAPVHRAGLGPAVQAFLDAGAEHEAADQRGKRRRARRLRVLLSCLTALSCIALGAFGIARLDPADGQRGNRPTDFVRVAAGASDAQPSSATSYTVTRYGYQGTFSEGSHVMDAPWKESFAVAAKRTIWHAWPGSGGWQPMPHNGWADDITGVYQEKNGSRRMVEVWVAHSNSYWCSESPGDGAWGRWRNCT
ncbi:XRE family transcriptional regulator [Streptomyces gamaensis]|uniref:XRE family transcriptional regulator n=1 Tax=Streptomyces gamaensis TaxID=1763542 RepID=A0ABW0YZE9_9ACTN